MSVPPAALRWFKFSVVGVLGIGAQLAALAFFYGALGLNYLGATALAVECAILHNFAWHECWTWRDRTGRGSAVFRLLRFQCGAGAVSLILNVGGMRLFAGAFRVPYLAANLLCIAAGAAANFVTADRFVFRTPRADRLAVGMATLRSPAAKPDNTRVSFQRESLGQEILL